LLLFKAWSAALRGKRAKDDLHPEKVVSRGFRTGVQFPSSPPKGYKANTYYFKDVFAITVWL